MTLKENMNLRNLLWSILKSKYINLFKHEYLF